VRCTEWLPLKVGLDGKAAGGVHCVHLTQRPDYMMPLPLICLLLERTTRSGRMCHTCLSVAAFESFLVDNPNGDPLEVYSTNQ